MFRVFNPACVTQQVHREACSREFPEGPLHDRIIYVQTTCVVQDHRACKTANKHDDVITLLYYYHSEYYMGEEGCPIAAFTSFVFRYTCLPRLGRNKYGFILFFFFYTRIFNASDNNLL